jgi:NADPH:quinone reductase-like Zn-dependent oxidoreductase
MAAIAIAKKMGATIITTTRTSKKRDLLLKAGAHHAIATEEEDLVERVMAITQGQGVDVIYDCIFGALSEKLAQAVKIRGHWIVCGVLDTTPVPFPLWTTFTAVPIFIRTKFLTSRATEILVCQEMK